MCLNCNRETLNFKVRYLFSAENRDLTGLIKIMFFDK
jgi:hypothetical protein